MEGLVGFAQEFLRDAPARARALEIDQKRESRLPGLKRAFEAFSREKIRFEDLASDISRALRETLSIGGSPVALWGFKNEDERAFPERLAQAAARTPEIGLGGVLRLLFRDAEGLADDERANRLLAFADFVADLDGRGAEGDPRLGVGPSANFLTFAWHVLTDGREPVFLFSSNKAIKAAEATGEPTLQARDLEGRFRIFYEVSRKLATALASAPAPMRQGWAVEHALEWTLEHMNAVTKAAAQAALGDPNMSGIWRPKSRAELRQSPPSGRLPVQKPLAAVAAASAPPPPAPSRSTVTITPPRAQDEKKGASRTDAPPRTERLSGLPKGKTIVAPSGPESSIAPPLVRTSADPAPAAARSEATLAATAPAEPATKPRIEPPASSVDAKKRGVQGSAETTGRLLSQALGELVGEIATAESDLTGNDAAIAQDELARSERLARDLGVEEILVSDLLDALARRGRVLLVGPLATGKTYLARRLALHVAGRDERTVFLRMHPGSSYDDLVEARLGDGTVRPGVVRELCDRAKRERDGKFALVLDEVDRCDLALALGELAGALSERGAEVRLARSGDRFVFPKNLVVIATGRAFPADLHGRFPVVEVAPDEEAVRRFFARSRPAFEWTAELLRELNRKLTESRGPHARLGHGLLMDAELDLPRLEGIWRREVLPLVRSLGLDPKGFEIGALKKS